MRMMSMSAAIALLAATGAAAHAQDVRPARSGWYLAAALGAGWGSDLKQEGWNRDTFWSPDAACFDEAPIPSVPVYCWRYDIALERGVAFDVSVGRFFGRTRLELALTRQTSGTRQTFTGIAYADGSPIRPWAGGTVASNDRWRVRSVSLDAYYDFPHAWGALNPYVGAGLGQTTVEFAGVRISADFRDTSAAAESYDPPLSFYNSVQDADLDDTAFVWRVHAGADYALGPRSSIGLRLTWAAIGDIEAVGREETHPMHRIDPDFSNANAFSGARNWTLMLVFRRRISD